MLSQFGATDAIWQMLVYWIMGALSNDPGQLAYLVGFYKAIQSVSPPLECFQCAANKRHADHFFHFDRPETPARSGWIPT